MTNALLLRRGRGRGTRKAVWRIRINVPASATGAVDRNNAMRALETNLKGRGFALSV